MATCADAAVRDGRESRRLAEEALRTAPAEDVSVLDTLAAAQAECGDFVAAVQTASRAITLAESAGRQDLLSALRARMALYEAHRPFRQ
jgi:Flp pilus assembly protein TadD